MKFISFTSADNIIIAGRKKIKSVSKNINKQVRYSQKSGHIFFRPYKQVFNPSTTIGKRVPNPNANNARLKGECILPVPTCRYLERTSSFSGQWSLSESLLILQGASFKFSTDGSNIDIRCNLLTIFTSLIKFFTLFGGLIRLKIKFSLTHAALTARLDALLTL